jgi:hypothetical protein
VKSGRLASQSHGGYLTVTKLPPLLSPAARIIRKAL